MNQSKNIFNKIWPWGWENNRTLKRTYCWRKSNSGPKSGIHSLPFYFSSTCHIGSIWSKYSTEIVGNRHFRSTSGETSDKEFTAWNFRGSPREHFFDIMTMSQDMDETDLFGEKLPKKAQLLNPSDRIQLFKIVCSDMPVRTNFWVCGSLILKVPFEELEFWADNFGLNNVPFFSKWLILGVISLNCLLLYEDVYSTRMNLRVYIHPIL